MESSAASQRMGVVVVDDDDADRSEVAACFEHCGSVALHPCESPDDLGDIPGETPIGLCILDIRFAEERVRITELIDAVASRWPNAIRIILTSYRRDISAYDRGRVDAVLDKMDFTTKPETLPITVRRVVQSRREHGSWPYATTSKECPFADPDRRTVLFQATGYVREVNRPHIEVVVEERPDGGRGFRELRMPYDMFAAVGIVAQDMRFAYRVYRQDNRIYSEVVPPPDDISWRTEMPQHLREIEEIEKRKRDELHMGGNHE